MTAHASYPVYADLRWPRMTGIGQSTGGVLRCCAAACSPDRSAAGGQPG